MRSILFLSDSVNRRLMEFYSESGVKLPNLERLAARSVIFDGHLCGSAPCMPARRDLMTGRLNFLERSWGPVEAMDHTLPQVLRSRGVVSHMITDHYHYFELGGENYCQRFDAWELARGQENDALCADLHDREMPKHLGGMKQQYLKNRAAWENDPEAQPSPMVITRAAQWLEQNHDVDNWLLWVEPFDPHEPFDVPRKYLDMVGDDYDGPLFMWPGYKRLCDAREIDEAAVRHVRRRYMALLYMTDEYIGRIFDVMDRYDMWRDTAFIYTTDHGYMLGEHGYMAKNYMPAYNEVFHIPLMVHLPGDEGAGRRVKALTQNIDVLPTLMELYGVPQSALRNPIHGKSLLPLIRGEKERVRDAAIYGTFGKQVNVTDGRYTLFRAPNAANRPLNLYTTALSENKKLFDHSAREDDPHWLRDPEMLETGRFLPWTRYPVYRIPADAVVPHAGPLNYVTLCPWEMEDYLFDLQSDYAQEHNLADSRPDLMKKMCALLKDCMRAHDAPAEQFERLRLT